MIVRILIGVILLASQAVASDCVVLLHGLVRSADSMTLIEETLVEQGYEVVNVDYPSREYTIEELAAIAVPDGVSQCHDAAAQRINFVTHSLGGILVRQFLATNALPDLGRVVMLGPPNSGSEAVDSLGETPGFDWINGPAGQQLGTGDDSVPIALGPVDFDLGVIAGTRSVNLILSAMLPKSDDGKVTVERTKVEGMCGFVALPTTHAFMTRNRQVIEQIVNYLEFGEFSGDDAVAVSCRQEESTEDQNQAPP